MKHIEKAIEQAKRRDKKAEDGETSRQRTEQAMVGNPNTALENIKYEEARSLPISSEQLVANRVVAHLERDPRSTPFDMLRTKVLKRMRNKHLQTLAICSATQGAGKSMVAANLAVSMAREGNSTVLLVDLDMRNPSIHKYFGIEPEKGIESHLEDGVPLSEILINPGMPRLTLLPGKDCIPHSSQLLSSKAFAKLYSEFRTRYAASLILFDLPPLLVVDDAIILADKVDASLLVVEEGKNTADEIQNSLQLLQSTDMLGTVLNKSESSTTTYYYGAR